MITQYQLKQVEQFFGSISAEQIIPEGVFLSKQRFSIGKRTWNITKQLYKTLQFSI